MESEAMRMVREFHVAVGAPISDKLAYFPSHAGTRHSMLREEVSEYGEACDNAWLTLADDDSMVEIADALADIVYVAYGGALEHGIDLDAVLREVHRSNMTKVRSDGSVLKRVDGKVLKPATYEPPNLRKALGLESD